MFETGALDIKREKVPHECQWYEGWCVRRDHCVGKVFWRLECGGRSWPEHWCGGVAAALGDMAVKVAGPPDCNVVHDGLSLNLLRKC